MEKLKYFELAQLMNEIRNLLPTALHQEAAPSTVFMVALDRYDHKNRYNPEYRESILRAQGYPRTPEKLKHAIELVVEEEYVGDVLELLTASLQWKS